MIINLKSKDCDYILSHNYIGYLSYIYLNKPYVVPITYFFKDNSIICYSSTGHKINAMRKHPHVSLQVASIDSVSEWKSVLVHGVYNEIEGSEAKALLHEFSLGIKDIIMRIEQKDLDYISEFSAKIYKEDLPIVFKIEIEGITGKLRKNN
ncbi:pyridoxamine 5'-phosphate oxidase family protein [Psychroserpens algicola]|uniref:Pyridoxamine 5'-phosphate oxidase family protein n=1 Tax=Psychroserpens algicola TaxID=1719034 RepID=A0ABT0H5P6_9FLAO|nr:pyridoxamine 5'-phosphate oxidase family protein [Psychroserpens algicola]MCK8479502.1 pyridoxamine 5'-phosphate oxidase family protein [Psychroserpens algicola]